MPFEVLSGEKRNGRRIFGFYANFSENRITGRLIFGLIVITLGVLWTLDNLGLVDSRQVLRWWPLLIVLFGICKQIGFGMSRQPVAGLVLSVVGLLMLFHEFDLIHFGIWQLWPLLMIALGVSLVVRSMRGPVVPGVGSEDRHNVVHSFAMMGGLNIKNESQEFRGGDVSAVMGGVELDLRGCRSANPQVVLDVFAWWGGIDVFVPKDWKVVTEVFPLMAGYEDHSRAPEGEAKTTLVIRGMAIMGGVEVKN
jgi:predicted membrane protein